MEAFVLHEPLRAKPMLMTTSAADKMRITEMTLRGLFIRRPFPSLRTGADVVEKGEAGRSGGADSWGLAHIPKRSLRAGGGYTKREGGATELLQKTSSKAT